MDRLAKKQYDLIVVGCGIYGAALAREAALRGLSVAVIDKGDFCGATSANSLKIIHGGVRYLQQCDIPRLRQSVVERRTFMKLAPHLVHPLPCAMPTYGHLMKSRELMFCGMLANDILSFDRNSGLAPDKRIPAGRVGPRAEWLSIVPTLDDPRYTGVAFWNDAYAYNTERLVLELLEAAVDAGAEAANYAEATGFKRQGNDISGVEVSDRVSGRKFSITGKMTVINTGAWTKETLALPGGGATCPEFKLTLAMNIVLKRQLIKDYAVGLTAYKEGWKKSRLFFFMPWRGRTMAGTYMRLHEGGADSMKVTQDDCRSFLASLNQAYPAANLQLDDIAFIQAGLLPAYNSEVGAGDEPVPLNHFSIVDHAKADGLGGLMTVVGVKYTTARDVAQRVVDRLGGKFAGKVAAAGQALKILPGGNVGNLENAVTEARRSGVSEAVARHLVYNYGGLCGAVLEAGRTDAGLMAPVSATAEVIGAEVVYAVRNEMAVTLADVVLRRTDFASAGLNDADGLQRIAAIMAAELGWDAATMAREIEAVRKLPALPG